MSRTATAYAYDYAPATPGRGHPARGENASPATETISRPVRARRVWTLRRDALVAFIALWIVVVAGALALVSRYAAMATTTYQMSDMKRQIAQVAEQNETLERQVAELKRPERIMEIAQTRLGMVPAQDFQQATNASLMAEAQETQQTGETIQQVALKSSGSGLSGTLDLIGRGLARLLAGPARTEAKGK